MPVPDSRTYLTDLRRLLDVKWPNNRTINIVCHGHSVPAGYGATPNVDTFNAYPHLWHRAIKARYPFAVVNVIVTAIGGEESENGAKRFAADVLSHRPDLITIDYALNDRRIGLDRARAAWRSMIAEASAARAKLLLLTPTLDITQEPGAVADKRQPLRDQSEQIRTLAAESGVGLIDSMAAFDRFLATSKRPLGDLLAQSNHPNRRGHDLVVQELSHWLGEGEDT